MTAVTRANKGYVPSPLYSNTIIRIGVRDMRSVLLAEPTAYHARIERNFGDFTFQAFRYRNQWTALAILQTDRLNANADVTQAISEAMAMMGAPVDRDMQAIGHVYVHTWMEYEG